MNPLQFIINEIKEEGLWEQELSLKRKEFLKVKGSTDTALYYIMDGTLRIFIEEEYEEHTVRFGYTSELITALDSFLTDNPSDFYIQALKKSSLKKISKEAFMKLINSSSRNRELWMKVLEHFVYQQMERERDLLTSSPKERYNRVFARSPHLFQVIPNKYIAAYLRMTPETLSRLKKS